MTLIYLGLGNIFFVGAGWCLTLAAGGHPIFLLAALILLLLALFFYSQMIRAWNE